MIIAVLVCGWVGWELYKLYNAWGTIREHEWNTNFLLLALAGVCYAIAYIPAVIYWRYVMQTLGQQPGLYECFRAHYIGHLGKYVPGKAMVLIIRTGLLNHKKTKITAAGASVFVETMTMMAVGAFVATLTMIIAVLIQAPWFQDFEFIDWVTPDRLVYLALGVMVCTVLPILPPVFHFVTGKLKKFQIELEGMRFRTLAIGWVLYLPVWTMLGFSLWLTMLGLGMESKSFVMELLFCTLAVSVSIVFGFASMLPGGLGTREFALRNLLILFFAVHPVGDLAPPVMAIVVAIFFRIMSILAELVASAVFARGVCEPPTASAVG